MRQAIRRFVTAAELTHSVDGYLIALGGLVSEIKDYGAFCEEYRGLCTSSFDPRSVFRKVLSCIEVINALRPLAGYVEDVVKPVYLNPRHKSLRPYLDIVIEVLNDISPSEKKLEVMRPPMTKLERSSRVEVRPSRHMLDTHSPFYNPTETREEDQKENEKPLFPKHKPIENINYRAITRGKKEVVKRILRYISLIILLIGIIYLLYIVLVKYELIESLQWI